MSKRTIVVVGMQREAEIVLAAHPGASVIIGVGPSSLEAAIKAGAERVISVGICCALNPALQIGNVVIGVRAVYGLGEAPCDPSWCDRLLEAFVARTAAGAPGAPWAAFGSFTWSPTAVARLSDAAALRKASGADVVDEETFVAGAMAAARGLPFAAMRVVSDRGALPPAATVQLTAAGKENMGEVLASILHDPWQIPDLIALGASSETAFANLALALSLIGEDFGVPVARFS